MPSKGSMMLLASLQNVSRDYGIQTVLKDVTLKISSKQKLGLIGPNGSGKTTILKILLGIEPPSKGISFLRKDLKVGYVPQYVDYEEDSLVLDYILAEYNHLAAVLHKREDRLSQVTEVEMDKSLQEYQQARDAYDCINGDNYVNRAKAMLDAFDLAGKENQRIILLSGGERNVLSMAKALLSKPDLLILDEPANHLDYLGIAWLEEFLKRFKGALLVVSHNRYLLDRVVNGILYLEDGRVTYYDGGYSDFRATQLRNLLAQQSDYIANQKRLAQLEALVNKFAQLARTYDDPKWGKRLRARRSQLERERKQAVEKPTIKESSIKAHFSSESSKANIALQLHGYNKAFGELKLFEDVNLNITCGERIALVGPNGCGKTTLLRDIVNNGAWENPVIRVGPSLRIGYAAQEQEILQGNRTILEEIMATAPMSRKEASAILARFQFRSEDFKKKISKLSGGERNRLQLARLIVLKPNFLILDEPTNHIDISAREDIEEMLEDFDGTILVVSHDRYFLDKIANRVVEVCNKQLISYPGNFTEYWYSRKETILHTDGSITKRRKSRERKTSKQLHGKELRELELKIRKLEQEKLNLEFVIAETFANREHNKGRRISKQLERLRTRLSDLYEKWIEVYG